MDFARVSRFDDERASRPRAFAHEMMVHAGRGEQARNRRELSVDAAIRQDQDVVAGLDGLARLDAQLLQRRRETRAAFFRRGRASAA